MCRAAHLGFGCGNPQAIADLRLEETVIDLGSGAGFDCFLAAKRVVPGGSVIGVDMTASMVRKARSNAKKAGIEGVEFRLGMPPRAPRRSHARPPSERTTKSPRTTSRPVMRARALSRITARADWRDLARLRARAPSAALGRS